MPCKRTQTRALEGARWKTLTPRSSPSNSIFSFSSPDALATEPIQVTARKHHPPYPP